MTTLKIDIRSMGASTHPDDRVILYAPEVRARIGGGLVSTAPLEVELIDGQATIQNVEPGPLLARFECLGIADTTEKRGVVPDSGVVTLDDVLELKFTWTPPIITAGVQQIIDEMNRAVGAVGTAVDGAMGGLVRSAESAARASAQSSAGSEIFANAANIRAASAETKVDNAVVRLTAVEALGGLYPESPVDGQTANLVAQADTLTRKAVDRASFLSSPHVDARAYGLWDLTTRTQDAAPILNAAANAAREQSRPLYIPAPRQHIGAFDLTSAYSIYSTVDLRYLDVICDANIVVRQADSVGVIVGDHASRRTGLTISMSNVKHHGTKLLDQLWDYPALRVMGVKGAYIKVAGVSFLDFYADGANAPDESIAYNSIFVQRVNHVRLHGVNGGWVNQNIFYGGSYNRLTISGDYIHNCNTFYKPDLEGADSLVDLQASTNNEIIHARTERGTKVRFSARTYQNFLSSLFQSNPGLLHTGFIVEEDLGHENVVGTVMSENMTAHTIFSISPETVPPGMNPFMPSPAENNQIVPSVAGGKVRLPGASHLWLDTGLLPLENPRGGTHTTLHPSSRVTRFNLSADSAVIRPVVWFYGSAGHLIHSATTTSMREFDSWKASPSGGYNYDAPVAGATMVITNPNAKYMRITAHSGGASLESRNVAHVTLTAHVITGHADGVVQRMRRALQRPMYSTTKPTSGSGVLGTIVTGPSGYWRSTFHLGTEVGAAPSVNTVSLVSSAGVAVGDVVGILLPDRTTHWATVSAVSGQDVTVSPPMPALPLLTARVEITRWKTISDPT